MLILHLSNHNYYIFASGLFHLLLPMTLYVLLFLLLLSIYYISSSDYYHHIHYRLNYNYVLMLECFLLLSFHKYYILLFCFPLLYRLVLLLWYRYNYGLIYYLSNHNYYIFANGLFHLLLPMIYYVLCFLLLLNIYYTSSSDYYHYTH